MFYNRFLPFGSYLDDLWGDSLSVTLRGQHAKKIIRTVTKEEQQEEYTVFLFVISIYSSYIRHPIITTEGHVQLELICEKISNCQ